MSATADLGALIDRFALVLQRARAGADGDLRLVRAIGPGAAGLPGLWCDTTTEAVRDWVERHGAKYSQREVA